MSNGCLNNGLIKLKELTEKLPPFPEVIAGKVGLRGHKGSKGEAGPAGEACKNDWSFLDLINSGYAEYKMDEGECFSWFIHRSGNDIAVHRWFITKGTKFPEHTHPEKEWLIVYGGVMELFLEDGTKITLNKGDSYYVLPNMKHWSTYPENCKFLTITIPPAKEFPHG